ncbi:MAG TPA: hypothetical protein VLZ81_16400 [Blastocatellia bacterium]|nr:hypothetical protein [Blastocatellia bacterium]
MQKAIPVAILAILLTNGCSHQAPVEDVNKAAAQFFLRLKGAEYDVIYKDAADKLREAKSQAEMQHDLEQLAAWGRPQQWTRISLSFKDQDKSRLAEPNYMVQTDKMTVNVTFTFVDDNGEWKVMGFTGTPHGFGSQ